MSDEFSSFQPSDEVAARPVNGRGAVSAPAGRFEKYEKRAVDDGWHIVRNADAGGAEDDEEPPKLQTHLHIDATRSVVNYIDSPDLGVMRSINPYRGCEHGCIYCFARPSHGYLGFSTGLDFETEILHKPDAPVILRKELAAKNYKPATITLGSNTDCYQPVERELKITRQIIEVLAETRHPLTIISKSGLVVRDIDLLAPMAAQGLASVNISLTTLDAHLARVMEPRAAAPYKRLKTMETLAKAGIPVRVMAAPMIPGLNDMEMDRIMQAAYDAGARGAAYTLVRLPWEIKTLFEEWLRVHAPDRADRVLSLIRQTHNGKLYDSEFGKRRTGEGPYAALLNDRFHHAYKRIGFDEERSRLRTDLFVPPPADERQFTLGL